MIRLTLDPDDAATIAIDARNSATRADRIASNPDVPQDQRDQAAHRADALRRLSRQINAAAADRRT